MPLTIVAAALLAVVLWGASPVAAKVAVESLTPVAVVLFRTIVGGMAALPLVLAMRIPLPAHRSQKYLLALSGFCGFVGFPLLFTVGVERTSANHASIILACLPIFTGAIAMAWDRKRPRGLWWVGCAIALGGEVLLVTAHDAGGRAAGLAGDLMVLASNLFASLGYVAGARLQRQGYSAVGTTFWGVISSAALLLPFAPFAASGLDLSGVPAGAWLAALYLAVGVTIIGYILWYWALGKGGIARIGSFQFLQPISGIVLAWLLLGEQLTTTFFMASALVLVGVWFVLKSG